MGVCIRKKRKASQHIIDLVDGLGRNLLYCDILQSQKIYKMKPIITH